MLCILDTDYMNILQVKNKLLKPFLWREDLAGEQLSMDVTVIVKFSICLISIDGGISCDT